MPVKFLGLAGLNSKTGDARRTFFPLMRFLSGRSGYDARRDFLEASYSGRWSGDSWVPAPYAPVHTRQRLMQSVEAFAGALTWCRDTLPPSTCLCILGYSLGGVIALDGATLALARDPAGWQGRIKAVITVASPMRGCSAGSLLRWAWLVMPSPDGLGDLGTDLERRWTDPAERQRVDHRSAFLRSQGVTLLTLADPDDAIVRPEESLLLHSDEDQADLLVRASHVRPGAHGHGSLVDEPAVWRRVLDAVGPRQAMPNGMERQSTDETGYPDPIELELRAIRERLRREGRLTR